MPLMDHFHPPLSTILHWESFHALRAGAIARSLDASLPEGYYAEVQVHVGSRVKNDVATFGESDAPSGGTATATWSAPFVTMTVPAVFLNSLEVLMFNSEGGPRW